MCCISQGLINVDYETEVEDDILPIFRKGEVSCYTLALYKVLKKFCFISFLLMKEIS